ncbi:hypothetical protein L1049_005296 [Liquidambar formosana]|uniref:SHSP domain-containing protein n=1 Tax=Liquidambar formosana TaxID=63359 RepID=A0AAP0RV65_LIQFO
MALARLALKNFHQTMSSSSFSSASLFSRNMSDRTLGNMKKQRWASGIVRSFSATADDKAAVSSDEKKGGQEVAVAEGGKKKSKLFPWRNRKRSLWRNNEDNIVPALYEFFPSGLGDALMQATENINRLFENLTPSRLIGRVKERDECYKIRYEMPGFSKDEVKITVEDGFLMIRGEHKEEKKEESEDEEWKSYGYYNTYLLLPDDAKADEIKAELKDGVLTIIISRTEKKKEVKEVPVQ